MSKKSLKLPRTKKQLHDVDFRCFQILGFDIMMDESQKLHLIEGNCAPSLNIYTKFNVQSGCKYFFVSNLYTFFFFFLTRARSICNTDKE